MCKVYNSLGSLMTIKAHLRGHNINEFKSIKELLNFQKNFPVIRQQIISEHSVLIEQERKVLHKEIAELNNLIKVRKSEVEIQMQAEIEQLKEELNDPTSTHNIFQRFIGYLKRAGLRKKIQKLQQDFDSTIAYSVDYLVSTLATKSHRYQYIVSCFDDAVNQSSLLQLRELERKKRIIDQVNNSIYGAFGERMVVKELEKLPDDFILINNFNGLFDPPIYYREGNDYISSVQIDHLLVSPAGIFLIETKNWSEQSLNNLLLRSPIEQVKRANFILFKLLAADTTNSSLTLHKHHWGDRKIPIRNVVVLTNQKPSEEFQYVKVLTVKELVSYVNYFKPSFSSQEIQKIADYLLSLNGQITDGRKIQGR
jgi:hypothetical protein